MPKMREKSELSSNLKAKQHEECTTKIVKNFISFSSIFPTNSNQNSAVKTDLIFKAN